MCCRRRPQRGIPFETGQNIQWTRSQHDFKARESSASQPVSLQANEQSQPQRSKKPAPFCAPSLTPNPASSLTQRSPPSQTQQQPLREAESQPQIQPQSPPHSSPQGPTQHRLQPVRVLPVQPQGKNRPSAQVTHGIMRAPAKLGSAAPAATPYVAVPSTSERQNQPVWHLPAPQQAASQAAPRAAQRLLDPYPVRRESREEHHYQELVETMKAAAMQPVEIIGKMAGNSRTLKDQFALTGPPKLIFFDLESTGEA